MGIPGLQRFIEDKKICPNGTHFGKISDKVKSITQKLGKNKASLAIDTNKCAFNWYEKTSRIGYTGGQWKEYKLTLEKFIDDCKYLSIDLVFFFDGATELGMKREFHRRQKSKLKENEKIFDCLDNGVTPKDRAYFAKTVPYFTKYILASLGQKVIYTDGDADYDIMKYAVDTPECIGIVAHDTNFLIYQSSISVFPPDCFFPSRNKAKMWNKPALLRSLGLKEEDMPLFACLMGNDLTTVHLHKLRRFRENLGGESMQSVANYLNSFRIKNGCNLKMLQDQILPNCEELIFSAVIRSYAFPNQKSKWIQAANQAIGNESARTNKFKCSKQLLSETKLRSHWISETLRFGVQKALVSYENGIFEPQFVLYHFIRERLYGIILSEVNMKEPVIEEWIGYTYNGDVELCHPVSVIHEREQATLQHLWDSSCPHNYKINVFEQCLGLTGHYDAVKGVVIKLPEYLLVSSYVLSYMTKNIAGFTQHDLVCLIECAIWCKDATIPFINRLPKVVPKARAVELASHYTRGLQIFLNANIVCGEPFKRESFIPTNTFDGLLFQSIYQDTEKFQNSSKNHRKCLTDLCLYYKVPENESNSLSGDNVNVVDADPSDSEDENVICPDRTHYVIPQRRQRRNEADKLHDSLSARPVVSIDRES